MKEKMSENYFQEWSWKNENKSQELKNSCYLLKNLNAGIQAKEWKEL